jgi:hypothetical protein
MSNCNHDHDRKHHGIYSPCYNGICKTLYLLKYHGINHCFKTWKELSIKNACMS